MSCAQSHRGPDGAGDVFMAGDENASVGLAHRRLAIIDLSHEAELIAVDRAGRVDGVYTIFSLMCFEIWCRMFIDGDGV